MIEAIGWVRYLRNAAHKIRASANGLPNDIVSKGSRIIAEASIRGFLKSIDNLDDYVAGKYETENMFSGLNFHLDHTLRWLIGFHDVQYEMFDSIAFGDPEDESTEYDVKLILPSLDPGKFAKAHPLVFSQITGFPLTETEFWQFKEDMEGDFRIEKNAEVLEYYALGCEILADLIEKNPEPEPPVATSEPPTLDGIYWEEKLLIWNGQRYEWLTETMLSALELLVKAYPSKVSAAAMDNRLGKVPEGGIRKIFKLGRKDSPERYHPVSKIVLGTRVSGWYLAK